MTERFMVDDAGTLIDMTNRNTYDYVNEVCGLLNDLHQEAKDNEHYHSEVLRLYKAVSKENEQLKQLLDYADDLIRSHLSEHFIRQWRNFKTGHKEYNDFWEEKIKKHNELKELE